MNPLWAVTLRRHWPAVGALFVYVLFMIVHLLVYHPLDVRYRATMDRAAQLGIPLEPEHGETMLSPRLVRVLEGNAMTPDEATERANSGALTSALLEDMTRLAAKHGVEVLATEQGPVTTEKESVQLRAEMRLRCRYAEFVSMLDDLARGGTLYSIDRFEMTSTGQARQLLTVSVSRFILKREGERP